MGFHALARRASISGRMNKAAVRHVPTSAMREQTDVSDMVRIELPLGRLGKVEEVAAMICWLCSEECSFSTGATFDISGGRSTY